MAAPSWRDDGGGHQDVRLVGSEGGHDGVLLLGLHLAVDEGHLEIRKHLGLELFGVSGTSNVKLFKSFNNKKFKLRTTTI